MSLFLENMTILDGAFDVGDVEVNFFKDDETNKMKCIEFTNRRFNQNISIKYEEIDNLIAMLQLVKEKEGKQL